MPRQERARVTREAILRAAAEEFERVGCNAGSLRNVLERIGVTKGAFYFHFPSKDAVVDELIKAQKEYGPKVYHRWAEQALDPLTVLVATVNEVAERLSTDVVIRAGFRLATERGLADARTPAPFAEWEETFARWLREADQVGLLRPGVDVVEMAKALHSMIVGARMVSFTLQRCSDYPQRVAQLWELVLPQIATEEWVATWRAGRSGAIGGPL